MYSPNEVLAMTAESWMFEEARNKFMIFNLRYILLLQGSLPSPANRHLLVYSLHHNNKKVNSHQTNDYYCIFSALAIISVFQSTVQGYPQRMRFRG